MHEPKLLKRQYVPKTRDWPEERQNKGNVTIYRREDRVLSSHPSGSEQTQVDRRFVEIRIA